VKWEVDLYDDFVPEYRDLHKEGAGRAFDPNRKAILLVAGDKSGVSEKGFTVN
jgi:hypothetical protein